jgi:hypothetical protein
MMQASRLVVACALVLVATAGQVQAGAIYMRSVIDAPWGESTNELAMDTAFGSGVWQDLRYETANAASVFSSSNSFAFLEGGDSNADELEAFLTSNISLIESWVAAGGSLFLNAAPNEGDGMSFGFGGVDLVYPAFSNDPVSAVDASHPIFTGPLPTTTSFTGFFFGHGEITGPALTSLMVDASNKVVLAERSFGLGHVIFGGMTTTNFHDPQPDAFNLRANILTYGASQANQVSAVPEPTSVVVFAFGACAAAFGASHRRRRQTVPETKA